MPPRNGPARRRTTDEVRALVLDAARELFTEQGYEDTTTRQVAHKAGVLEHLIFRNFTNKAGLFDAAVVTPLADLVADYAARWDRDGASSTPEERIAGFIEGLFDLASSNRSLLVTILARSEGTQPGRTNCSTTSPPHFMASRASRPSTNTLTWILRQRWRL